MSINADIRKPIAASDPAAANIAHPENSPRTIIACKSG
jgi:hypothetical protein